MHKESVTTYLRHVLGRKNRFICGANLQYELEGLESEGIQIQGNFIDVQIAEALIDEETSAGYSLEALCRKYLGGGKDESLLKEAASLHGFKNVKANLWKLHSKYVGPYAEFDALSPLKIFEKQKDILKAEELESIFELECKLLPILWKMRKRGIRMDMDGARKLSSRLEEEEHRKRIEVEKRWGTHFDEWSGPIIADICKGQGIHYPKTAIGNPSFTSDFLDSADHPLFDDISELRELNRMRETFVNGWILDNAVGDRIHPQWRQMASDEGGTRTGRMAAANPNPQQVPAGKYRKTGKPNPFGIEIRAKFIPEEGLKWAKFDYDQQEPRILIHFAELCKCTGATVAAMAYRNARDFDLYDLFSQASGLARRPTKDCYLGRCYGMGIKKLAYKFNKTEAEAKEILGKFDAAAPYVKEVAEMCMNTATRRGYVKTLLGRRRHFRLFEPEDSWKLKREFEETRGQSGDPCIPLPEAQAQERWRGKRLKRFGTHKALNALVQGSAADQTKAAMITIYEKYGEYPYMQVHDEINFGVRDEEHAKCLHECIESSVKMTVPVVSDMDYGDHWK